LYCSIYITFNRPKIRQFFELYHNWRCLCTCQHGYGTWMTPGLQMCTSKARLLPGGDCDKQKACCQCHLRNAPGRHISVTNVHLPRKRMAELVMTDAPCQSVGSCSSSGWTDSDLFLRWLEHLANFTNVSFGVPQIIILNGHHNHKILAVVGYARSIFQISQECVQ